MDTRRHDIAVEYRYTDARRSGTRLLQRLAPVLCLCALTQLGCPRYEDTYSGTYLEVRDELSEEVMVIDLFRFGNYANAVVRTYRAPQSGALEEILDQQIDCAWTGLGDAPGEDGTLRLEIPGSLEREEMTLTGTFLNDEELELELRSGEVVETRRFRLFRDTPNNDCEEQRPFLIQPDFDVGDAPNVLPTSINHTIQRPVFAILWLGVQARRQDNGAIVWIGKSELSANIFLGEDNRIAGANGLEGELSLSITPPSERMLTESGDTRYALAHFVVIDDACEDGDCAVAPGERFAWDIDSEPIIATALQRGTEANPQFEDATGLGKALLYVEGKLGELHPNMRDLMVNVDAYEGNRDGAHFYIVDVFFDDNDNIVGLRLPEDPRRLTRPTYRSVGIKVTADYIKATQILLPRLLPVDEF